MWWTNFRQRLDREKFVVEGKLTSRSIGQVKFQGGGLAPGRTGFLGVVCKQVIVVYYYQRASCTATLLPPCLFYSFVSLRKLILLRYIIIILHIITIFKSDCDV
jgi:hypothetical protein